VYGLGNCILYSITENKKLKYKKQANSSSITCNFFFCLSDLISTKQEKAAVVVRVYGNLGGRFILTFMIIILSLNKVIVVFPAGSSIRHCG
jgi:hypothetical protein